MTGAGMAGLMYFASTKDDPYVDMKDVVRHLLLFFLKKICKIKKRELVSSQTQGTFLFILFKKKMEKYCIIL